MRTLFLLFLGIKLSASTMTPDGAVVYTDKTEYMAYVNSLESPFMFATSQFGVFSAPISIYERDTVLNLVNCQATPQAPQCSPNGVYGQVNGSTWNDHLFSKPADDPTITNNTMSAMTQVLFQYIHNPFGVGATITLGDASVGILFGVDHYTLPAHYSGFFGVVRAPGTQIGDVEFWNGSSAGTDITISNLFANGAPVSEPSYWLFWIPIMLLLPPDLLTRSKNRLT